MSKTILIVEDVADIRRMMRIMVKHCGFETITARDGYEAIEKVKEFRPDLILMDLKMPVLDGVTAIQIIREFSDRTVPIVALTAYPNNYREKAVAAGCNEVISKPLDFENFEPLLNKYLA